MEQQYIYRPSFIQVCNMAILSESKALVSTWSSAFGQNNLFPLIMLCTSTSEIQTKSDTPKGVLVVTATIQS
jgi:hypothetical protein